MKEPNYGIMKEMAEKYSTVPLVQGWKQPVLKNWEDGATSRWKTTSISPGQNLGIICGLASGISVIDVDNPKKFEHLAKIHGFIWEDYFVVKTPNKGGYHIYFKFNEAMARFFNQARVNLSAGETGCELMIQKCFVVSPGSYLTVCPKTNKQVHDYYRIINDGPVADEPPEWLMKIMIKEFKEIMRSRNNSNFGDQSWKKEPWDPERCWKSCHMVDRLINGKRNDMVYWFAKILVDHGNGPECIEQVAQLVDEATDNSFTYREAVTTLTNRITKLTQDRV